MSVRSLKDGTIVLRVDDNGAGSEGTVTVDLEEGDLQYTERRPSNILSDRGVLDHARKGSDAETELSFSMMFQSLGTHADPTPYQVMRHLGTAAAWESQEPDSDTWAIDLQFTITDPAGGASEVLSFDRFEPEEFTLTEGDPFDTLAVSGRAPRRPWPKPDDIPGLIGWYAADYLEGGGGLVDTDPVETWLDLSNHGNNLAQATAGERPTLQTNEINTSLPIVRFDGTDDSLRRTLASVVSQPYSYMIVAKHVTGTVASDENIVGGLASDGSTDSGQILATVEAGTDQVAMDAGTEAAIGDLSGSFFVLIVAFDGASSVARYDGVQSAESAGTENLEAIVLGANGAEDGAWSDIDVAEFAVYERKLSVAHMRSLEDYVNQKYGI